MANFYLNKASGLWVVFYTTEKALNFFLHYCSNGISIYLFFWLEDIAIFYEVRYKNTEFIADK